jgi:serine/threonine-protein kinase
MAPEDDLLTQIAGSVADGDPVDWEDAARRAATPRERASLLLLRDIEGIARVSGGSPSRTPLLSADPQESPTMPPAGPAVGAQEALGGPARARAARERWGHLEIIERLGEGAFGSVYRAWDPKLDREVALKLLRFGSSPRIGLASAVITDGRLMAKVRHRNVATVYGADQIDGRLGVWMELIRGRTLEALLEEQGPFSAREAALIGMDLCRALAAVHGAGLIHRDVKAQNVMREEGGRILLMDFGAGVDVGDSGSDVGGDLVGTPFYMAPEFFRNREITTRADIYSLGVLLHHLVTGS